jgi:hypothetical protein
MRYVLQGTGTQSANSAHGGRGPLKATLMVVAAAVAASVVIAAVVARKVSPILSIE